MSGKRRRVHADRALKRDDVVFDAMLAVPLGPRAPVDRLVIIVAASLADSLMRVPDLATRKRRLWAVAGHRPPLTAAEADALRNRALGQPVPVQESRIYVPEHQR